MTDLRAHAARRPDFTPSLPVTPLRHRLSSRSLRRAPRWRRTALLSFATAMFAATPLGAQSVLGYGDDATTVPGGIVRIGLLNTWSRWFQQYDAAPGVLIQTRSQARITPFSLDFGLTDRLMFTASVPTVGTTESAIYFSDPSHGNVADSMRSFNRSGIGDAMATLKLVWLGEQSEHDRIAEHGLHVRSALSASAVIGTGQPPRPFQQFGVGTGEGESGVQAGSFWDFIDGQSFWTSVALRYEHHLQDTRSLRVGAGTPGDPFDATARPVNATRRLGDAYSIDVTPRFSLGEYFSLGARYQYAHENAGTFSGTLDVVDSAGNVTHLDAAALGPASAFTNQWVGVGLVYSSVAASERGHGNYAFEITLQYRRQIALTNGQPVRGEWAAGLRFYQKLWGRGMVGRDVPDTTQRRREP
ncbi:MAG TPA: hypothetical protein VF118_01500 [Gemmatimonadaceae bacterium]